MLIFSCGVKFGVKDVFSWIQSSVESCILIVILKDPINKFVVIFSLFGNEESGSTKPFLHSLFILTPNAILVHLEDIVIPFFNF